MKKFNHNELLDIAYFVGAMQTDGCLSIYFHKSSNKFRYKMDMYIGEKSLPMLCNVQKILKKVFDRNISIYKQRKKKVYCLTTSVKNLMPIFEKLDIQTFSQIQIPHWIKKNIKYFGAFLAGVIDGDGNITIKRKKYPMCYIRIFSNVKLLELLKNLERYFNCKTHNKLKISKSYFEHRCNKKEFSCYIHGFYVSNKNKELFKKYILPYIQLNHKKETLSNFIETRYNK